MLMVFAGGSLVIQSWFGDAVNRATGVPQFNNLVQGVWGVLSVAVTLEFVAQLTGRGASMRARMTRRTVAVGAAAVMATTFALTPPSARFHVPTGFTAFTVYTLVAAAYTAGAAAVAAWGLWRHLRRVRNRTLFVALLFLAIGNSIQVPFMAIRTAQRLVSDVPKSLLDAAFTLSTSRFILVPVGCALVALEPLRQALVWHYRRLLIFSLWRDLRGATLELTSAPMATRFQDLLTVRNSWELLHRRVVEIRDSIHHLHEVRTDPHLLEAAERSVDPGSRDAALTAAACWIAVARQRGWDGTAAAGGGTELVLPELHTEETTLSDEIRVLRRLHRLLHSDHVTAFVAQYRSLLPTSVLPTSV